VFTSEGLDVKCEKGEKMSVHLQIEEMPAYLKARFIGAGATEAWVVSSVSSPVSSSPEKSKSHAGVCRRSPFNIGHRRSIIGIAR
jgi:hypothetical protein